MIPKLAVCKKNASKQSHGNHLWTSSNAIIQLGFFKQNSWPLEVKNQKRNNPPGIGASKSLQKLHGLFQKKLYISWIWRVFLDSPKGSTEDHPSKISRLSQLWDAMNTKEFASLSIVPLLQNGNRERHAPRRYTLQCLFFARIGSVKNEHRIFWQIFGAKNRTMSKGFLFYLNCLDLSDAQIQWVDVCTGIEPAFARFVMVEFVPKCVAIIRMTWFEIARKQSMKWRAIFTTPT